MKYKTNKIINNQEISVTIELADDCKNGHQDFSITADIYEAGKRKIDKNFIAGGCCHDEILKAYPEFKIFVDLHLCDYNGVPMYAVANGYYFLKNGFCNNGLKPDQKFFDKEFCNYYNIDLSDFEELNKSFNQTDFALKLESLGILQKWKDKAQKAIKYLEELTGQEFVNTSTRSNFVKPTKEEIEDLQEKLESGYFTKEAQELREQNRIKAIKEKLKEDLKTEKEKLDFELEIKLKLLDFGEKYYDNCIFYNHSKEIGYNWKSYDLLNEKEIKHLLDNFELPKGVTFKKP